MLEIIRKFLRFLFLSVIFFFNISVFAQNVNARYPWRLPDWLWDNAINSHLVSAEEALIIRSDILKINELNKLEVSPAKELLKIETSKRIAIKFNLNDLTRNAYVVANKYTDLALAIELDPSFSSAAKETIRNAISLFLRVALDPEVIEKAYSRSTKTPEPMPVMYETKDGKPLEDAAGRPVFTEDYAYYLGSRPIPGSAKEFSEHLGSALRKIRGSPQLIVISSYKGNIWWGGAYYGFYSDPVQSLNKEIPPTGYFYIRLNTDKFLPTEPGWDDPNFWAAKIAHEILHNLNYWHPDYSSIKERNENNHGDVWSFVYSYEQAIYEKLKATK